MKQWASTMFFVLSSFCYMNTGLVNASCSSIDVVGVGGWSIDALLKFNLLTRVDCSITTSSTIAKLSSFSLVQEKPSYHLDGQAPALS